LCLAISEKRPYLLAIAERRGVLMGRIERKDASAPDAISAVGSEDTRHGSGATPAALAALRHRAILRWFTDVADAFDKCVMNAQAILQRVRLALADGDRAGLAAAAQFLYTTEATVVPRAEAYLAYWERLRDDFSCEVTRCAAGKTTETAVFAATLGMTVAEVRELDIEQIEMHRKADMSAPHGVLLRTRKSAELETHVVEAVESCGQLLLFMLHPESGEPVPALRARTERRVRRAVAVYRKGQVWAESRQSDHAFDYGAWFDRLLSSRRVQETLKGNGAYRGRRGGPRLAAAELVGAALGLSRQRVLQLVARHRGASSAAQSQNRSADVA
jgi:hypothetical protein